MALTEQEREWLETRKNLCGRCERRKSCRVGKRHNFNTHECRFFEFSAWDYFCDTASFESLVAHELTNPAGDYMPLCTPEDCDFRKRRNCRECRLMHARIAVEQEMKKC